MYSSRSRPGQDPLISPTVVDSLVELVKQQLAANESIDVWGFGRFQPNRQAAKVGRDSTRNIASTSAAHPIPSFKPNDDFVEQVQPQLVTK